MPTDDVSAIDGPKWHAVADDSAKGHQKQARADFARSSLLYSGTDARMSLGHRLFVPAKGLDLRGGKKAMQKLVRLNCTPIPRK